LLCSIKKQKHEMKKTSILFFIGCLFMTVAANAQEFKKFRVGLGLGYAMASGSGSKGGVLATIEPGYYVNDAILVNLRLESAVITRGFSEDLGDDIEFDVAGIGSYTLNGQYYFKNEGFRPFVGAGLGIYSLAAVTVSADGTDVGEVAAESKFGFYPRAGFDAGHFTLCLDYNLIPAVETEAGDIKNSYLGFRIGAFIGGGRK
jgi:outer membrane protein W